MAKEFPLVSIVLATYNGEKYLSQQLDSVLSQTYSPIEVIAVDDGSTDSTIKVLHEYAKRHPNMKVVVNDKTLGYKKNFEKGCSLSAGDYISFCDQDDVWESNKTEILMQSIDNYPMVYCDDEFVNEKLETLGKKHSDLKNLTSFDNCGWLC